MILKWSLTVILCTFVGINQYKAQKCFSERKLRQMYATSKNICQDVNKIEVEKVFFQRLSDTSSMNYSCIELHKKELFSNHKNGESEIGLYLVLLPQHHMNKPKILVWINKNTVTIINDFSEGELNKILEEVSENKSSFKSGYSIKIRKFFKKCK